MLKKKITAWFLAAAMVLCMAPVTAFAGNTTGEVIDFAQFMQRVQQADYQYDGQGITVRWSPSSACVDTRPGHNCLFEGEAPKADGNNPQRGQAPNAQYQIFDGVKDISISNVNFVFEPADFTICQNASGDWRGHFLAQNIQNAELQLKNTGSVTFTGCQFDRVIVSPYSSQTTTTITGCSFANVFDSYAIKDIYSASATIQGCQFENCGGGIYFEGTTPKKDIVISQNQFKDMDTNALEAKKNTRGLIQFSAKGDYSGANISIQGNASTGNGDVLRQLNNTVTAAVLDLDQLQSDNSFAGNLLTGSTYGANTVYYNGSTYPTLADALTVVYTSAPTTTAKVYCKPGADVGALTHGHVADDLIIYGNGATITSGEGDLEFDTYKYDRQTGKRSDSGEYLQKDITVAVFDLNGVAAWGQRNTAYTVNIAFENCQNMDRVYFTNTANEQGKINIALNGCSFNASLGSNPNTSVYSNAAGDIAIYDTQFTGIAVGLNINHKSAGVQNITLDGCTFTDCALPDISAAQKTTTYGAPVRAVARQGATTNLVVNNTQFVYTGANHNCGNGDILIGDGRYNASAQQGIVTLATTNTAATVMVQQPGYYTSAAGDTTNPQLAKTALVSSGDVLIADTQNHFVLDNHTSTTLVGQKDATCTAEGYTGDTVCALCGKVIAKGQVIPKTQHNYQNGVCTVCGQHQSQTDSPQTGDTNAGLALPAVLLVSAAALLAAKRRKTHC